MPDEPNKKLEHINYNGTTYDLGVTDTATINKAGLMSAADKQKLDSIDAGASGLVVVDHIGATNSTNIATLSVGGDDIELYTPNYSGTSPINVNNTTKTISHENSGVSADTYGTTGTTLVEPTFGEAFSVPGVQVNATGHITSAGAHNVKIPSLSYTPNLTSSNDTVKVGTLSIDGTDKELYAPKDTNTTYALSKSGNVISLTPNSGTADTITLNTAAQDSDGLMSSGDKQKLDSIQTGATATSFSQTKTAGKELGTIAINGTDNVIYDNRDI